MQTHTIKLRRRNDGRLVLLPNDGSDGVATPAASLVVWLAGIFHGGRDALAIVMGSCGSGPLCRRPGLENPHLGS